MLFPGRFWPALADGSLKVAYRRQKKATVKPGGTLNSPGGLLAIDAVDAVTESDISEADAIEAGHESRAELIASLRPEGTLYRIQFHRAGDDPRRALRADAALDDATLAIMRKRLASMEWAEAVLCVIRDNPRVVSTELAPLVGMERPDFKLKVRRLKALGLTESFSPGYEISPRGLAVLSALFPK